MSALGIRTADGSFIDNSWELNIHVTDLDIEKALRVTGDLKIGTLIHKLVTSLDIIRDWSDHSLWWPKRNMWLSHFKLTLEALQISSGCTLQLTPTHKPLKIQFPDLQIINFPVDFSVPVFECIRQLGKDLSIHHPEELSFLRKSAFLRDKRRTSSLMRGRSSNSIGSSSNYRASRRNSVQSSTSSQGSRDNLSTCNSHYQNHNFSTPVRSFSNESSPTSINSYKESLYNSQQSVALDVSPTPSKQTIRSLPVSHSYSEKAKLNSGWLDSNSSLMEQNIRGEDILLLRFKWLSFPDLDPKTDSIRINQLYEQAKWSILTEEVDCTDEEMFMFSALHLQCNLQANMPQPETNYGDEADDIDAALNDLQVTLDQCSQHDDITSVPELRDYMKMFKSKAFMSRNQKKKYSLHLRDLTLTVSRSAGDSAPTSTVSVRNCEVYPDVNIENRKYKIRLHPQVGDEMWLQLDSEKQYSKWMAALRLASRGKTMADSSYDSEVHGIEVFLKMQHRNGGYTVDPSRVDVNSDDLVAHRFLKKYRSRQLAVYILEAHTNVSRLTLINSKLEYIKAWQRLPEYGISYFIVKFRGSKRSQELLGLAYDRIINLDLSGQTTIRSWRYDSIRAWHVNWDVREMCLQFENGDVFFSSPYTDIKVIHEFIGGFIFLEMSRAPDKNQSLDVDLFHKLTIP